MPGLNTVYYGSSKVGSPALKALPAPAPQPTSFPDSDISIHDEESFRQITQEMYKQNVELAVRNKTLGVLRELYSITMSTLELREVAQRIVDTIVKELNFTTALISLVDEKEQLLRPVAITQSPGNLQAMKLIGKTLEEITIPLTFDSNLAIAVLTEKQKKVTGNLLDILIPHVTQEEADQIEKITKIKTLIILPVLLGERAIGVLNIALSKKVDDLSRAESETLEQLMNIVSIALDRARLYDDLKIANVKLQELDKLKDEFVSLASHELRTPMTAIKGSLSTILDGYAGTVSDESREFLSAAYNENDRLIRLVNNLLNISRIEAGRFTFNLVKLDMAKVCTEVVHNLEMAAKEKNIYLTYKNNGAVPAVDGDEDKVKEVLINFIGNALKFTYEGGITVETSVADGFVVTSVADTGHGIAKEDQELLFKKFSQVGSSYATSHKPVGGTGLGLYISKQIIEGLKGKIWLESTVGKGSTFYFSLPVAK